jgi:ADP-ribosylglycohydrolase
VSGGGPFAVAAGQVTDDTQLAVALHRSLHACGGLDVEDLGARYVAWVPDAFDIGSLTGGALALVASGVAAADAGRQAWWARGGDAAGNGSLMRTAPIGVYAAARPDAPSYEAALVDVVNRGGDADTNGAIAGALMGAFHGDAAIPGRWRTAVLSALDGGASALATEYHPRAFVRG